MKNNIPHINRIISFLLFTLAFIYSAYSQEYSVKGQVTDLTGKPVPFASVVIEGTQKGTLTDDNGYFSLSMEMQQERIYVQSMGYETTAAEIPNALPGSGLIRIALKPSEYKMDEVLVSGKSTTFKLKEKAFNVAALEVNKLQNANLDVGNVLSRVTGVNIREQGGLGSGFIFSINGLSGKQVKFFMDGVPMDNYGSSFSINNIPVNLIERVEVYKGVGPVWLGSDALGGAVNIITRENDDNYLDASYSFGSFNTHKVAINGFWSIGSKGLSMQTTAFYNYSDNNYRVDDLEKHDLLGNVTGNMSAIRFHDSYRSAMLQTKVGFQNRSFADKLFVGLTASGNHNNVQHGMSLERVFGQVHTRDRIVMPMFEYKKENLFMHGLSLSSYASYINGQYEVVDTSSREYKWDGSYTIRNNPNIGESDWQKSLFTFNDETVQAVNNARYENGSHTLAFNHTYSLFIRQGNDPFDPDIVPFSDPNHLEKSIFGFSYTKTFLNQKVSATLFSKYFLFNGKTIQEELYNENPTLTSHFTVFKKPGYGFAGTWKIMQGLQVKTSYENTYRLPDGREIFGNGLNIISNPLLAPEHSNNYNLGVFFHTLKNKNNFNIEANYFYRNASNLIRLAAAGAKGEYVNLSRANIQGIETEFTYKREVFTFTLNGTYQNLVNRTKFNENGTPNHTYLDRLPNIPYLFGNVVAGYTFHDFLNANGTFRVYLHSRYVNEFFLQWPGHGEVKPSIPTQFIQNLECDYSFRDGKYNFSLAITNLLDSKAYDNFRIQKPGRAYYIKLRYFFKK